MKWSPVFAGRNEMKSRRRILRCKMLPGRKGENMREVEPTKIKQMRIFILENLNRVYPTPLQMRTLFKVIVGFDENYDKSLLAKDLSYLKQKKYIVFVDDAIGGALIVENKFVGLTAEGKEIAERTQTDPALEI